MQHHIALSDGKARLHPQQAVGNAGVFDRHALGPPGGTGSKDHVGWGIRRQGFRLIMESAVRHPCANGQRLKIRREHALAVLPILPVLQIFAEGLRKARLAQHHALPEVFKHRPHALGGQGGGKRHVHSPKPQHGKNAGQHCGRALKTHAHILPALHALPLQPCAHGIHLRVELRVGNSRACGVQHCRSMGSAGSLSAKTAVHVCGDIQRFRRIVKAGKFRALLRWQDIQFGQGLRIVSQHGVSKGQQALGHAADCLRAEKLGAVFHIHRIAAVRPLLEVKTQVKLAALVRQGQRLHAQGRTAKIVPACVFQRGKHVKYGIARGISLHPHGFDNLFKGAALHGQRFSECGIHRACQFGKTALRVHARPHCQRVDKEAHNSLNLLMLPVCRRATHNNVVLPGMAEQKGIHQRKQHGKYRYPGPLGPVLEGVAALKPQIKTLHGPFKTLYRRAGVIQRQAQTLRQGREVAAYLLKPFRLPLRFPQGVACKIQIQGPPLRHTALQHSAVGFVEFAGDNFRRPAVKYDVMEAEHQRMAAVLLPEQGHAHQGPFRPQRQAHAQVGCIGQGGVVAFKPQAASRGKALLRRIQRHAQAQGIVPFLKQCQSLLQGHCIHGAAQPGRKGNHINLTALMQLLQKPDALLGWRQGVGCKPFHSRNNSIRLCQTANAGGKGARAGVAHHILYAHRHREALAQLREQAHGYQAVPAKLEKIRIHRIHRATKHGGIGSAHGFRQSRHIRPLRGLGLPGCGGSVTGRIFCPVLLCAAMFSCGPFCACPSVVRRFFQRKAGTPAP
ncbi:hypothetical protein DSECCO2_173740 [anaerobic digester metagenome]